MSDSLLQKSEVLKTRTISEEAWQTIQTRLNQVISKNEELNSVIREKISENEHMREAIHKLHDTNEELQDLNKLLALNYSDEIKSLTLSQEEEKRYTELLKTELNERKKDVDEWKVRYFQIESEIETMKSIEKEVLHYLPCKQEAEQMMRQIEDQMLEKDKNYQKQKEQDSAEIKALKQQIDDLKKELVKKSSASELGYANYLHLDNNPPSLNNLDPLYKRNDQSNRNSISIPYDQQQQSQSQISQTKQKSITRLEQYHDNNLVDAASPLPNNQIPSFNVPIVSNNTSQKNKNEPIQQDLTANPTVLDHLDKQIDNMMQRTQRKASQSLNENGSILNINNETPLSNKDELNKSHTSGDIASVVKPPQNRKNTDQTDEFDEFIQMKNESFSSNNKSPNNLVRSFLDEDHKSNLMESAAKRFSFQQPLESGELLERKSIDAQLKGGNQQQEGDKIISEKRNSNASSEQRMQERYQKQEGGESKKSGKKESSQKRLSFQKELQIKVYKSQNNSDASDEQEDSPTQQKNAGEKAKRKDEQDILPVDEIIQDKHTDENLISFAGKKILEGRIAEERQKQETLYRRLSVMESEKSKLLLLLQQKTDEMEKVHAAQVMQLNEKVKVLEEHQAALQDGIEQLQKELTTLKAREEELEGQVEQQNVIIMNYHEKEIENEEMLKNHQSQLEQKKELEIELTDTKNVLEELQTEYSGIVKSMEKTVNSISQKLQQDKENYQLSNIALEKEILTQRNLMTQERLELERKYIELKASSEVDQENAEKLAKELKEAQSKLRQSQQRMKDTNEEMEENRRQMEGKIKQLQENQIELERKNEKLSKTVHQLEFKEKSLKKQLQTQTQGEEETKELKAQMEVVAQIVGEFEEEKRQYEQNILQLAERISELQEKFTQSQKEKTELEIQNEKQARLIQKQQNHINANTQTFPQQTLQIRLGQNGDNSIINNGSNNMQFTVRNTLKK